MAPLNDILICLLLVPLLSKVILCVHAIRGDRQQHREDRDRRLQATKKNTLVGYYTYSQGRGGVSKQEEIREKSPSTAPSGSTKPSTIPSAFPSIIPSTTPSDSPSLIPTASPSMSPSFHAPSNAPSGPRSAIPSPNLSDRPTFTESNYPSHTRRVDSTTSPSSNAPSMVPSIVVSGTPSTNPSVIPSVGLSEKPSVQPSTNPSLRPSSNLSATPTSSPVPSSNPTYGYSYDDISVAHNFVGSPQWPGDSVWQSELSSLLSSGARLMNNMQLTNSPQSLDDVCVDVSTFGEFRANLVCLAEESCHFQFCNLDGRQVSNLPAYTVDVRTTGDIMQALSFAERHNIQVSIKTTGHNFAGASFMKNSLNILMTNFPKDGSIKTIYTDSCGTQHIPTIGINGGEVWGDVYNHYKRDYHFLSGDTRTVSAAGGWLQGIGLSHTSRMYGVGVDNVVSFDAILPTGQQVRADACSNSDLFWALRGGGGGTFGVVTHVEYKVLPKTNITIINFRMDQETYYDYDSARLFLEYWIQYTPTADRRVGGAYFAAWSFEVFVLGDEAVAEEVFLSQFRAWYDRTFQAAGFSGNLGVQEFASFYDYMGGDEPLDDARVYVGHGPHGSARIVPEDKLVNDPGGFLEFIMELHNYEWWESYWLGGAVNDVPAGATAVHPAMRSAIWAISTWNNDAKAAIRKYLPDGISGSSFNHQGANELNWRTSLWGEENYKRLLGIKNRYDPSRRLNCWHCVGYQGEEFEDVYL